MKKAIIAILLTGIVVSKPVSIEADVDKSMIYSGYIQQVADEYGICPELIESMIYYESNWNTNAKSSAGAVGLMQVTPKWNRDRMKRLGVTDLTDPYQNILVGTDIIAEYSEKYDVYVALAAYNCGEYSKSFKRVQNGAAWGYSDKILERSAELESAHGK